MIAKMINLDGFCFNKYVMPFLQEWLALLCPMDRPDLILIDETSLSIKFSLSFQLRLGSLVSSDCHNSQHDNYIKNNRIGKSLIAACIQLSLAAALFICQRNFLLQHRPTWAFGYLAGSAQNISNLGILKTSNIRFGEEITLQAADSKSCGDLSAYQSVDTTAALSVPGDTALKSTSLPNQPARVSKIMVSQWSPIW